MSGGGNQCDDLVDRFVRHINTHARERLWCEEIPPSVREGGPDQYDYYDWRIKPSGDINWIEALEQRLPWGFPPLYRSFVTRYIFPSFCIKAASLDEIQFLANTPEGNADHELRERVLVDDGMIPILLEHGYLYFANPTSGGDYDPLCFDMNRTTGRDDHPIVRFDHEQLFKRVFKKVKLKYISEPAGSLEEIFTRVIES